MDLIEHLLDHGQTIDHAAGTGRLGDDDFTGLIDLCDRIADLGEARHILVAGIGKIATGHLRTAFEQMARERSGGEPVPVVGGPAERMQQRSQCQR